MPVKRPKLVEYSTEEDDFLDSDSTPEDAKSDSDAESNEEEREGQQESNDKDEEREEEQEDEQEEEVRTTPAERSTTERKRGLFSNVVVIDLFRARRRCLQ